MRKSTPESSIEAEFQRGLALHRNGRLEDAKGIYERLLTLEPSHSGAIRSLAAIAVHTNDLQQAEALLRRATRVDPRSAAAHLELGRVQTQLGHLTNALTSYDNAIDADPGLAEAHLGRGLVLQFLQRRDEAIPAYDRAIALKPTYSEAYYHRGNTLTAAGRLNEALQSFDQTVALCPTLPAAYYNRGNVLIALKRFEEALADFARALALRPDYAHAYNNHGTALMALGRPHDALASFDQAISRAQGLAEAHYNRGNALKACGRLDEALASYRQAIELKPHYPEALNNLGSALAGLTRLDEALESYNLAIQQNPLVPSTYVNHGNALRDLGRLDEAFASYDQAMRLDRDFHFLYGTWLHTKMRLCDWDGVTREIAELSSRIGRGERVSSPFPVITLVDSEDLQLRAAEVWVAERHPLTVKRPAPHRCRQSQRVRLGYYSSDFRDHATTFLVAGVLEQHDRTKFELIAFSFGPATNDAMMRRVSAAFDQFIDVRTKSDEEIALISRQMEIDIAIDLKGFTQGHRAGIFAYRAAPIQVSYLGFPGSMGAEYIDYLVVDQTVVPPHSQQFYREKLAYLPNSYQANDRLRSISGRLQTRQSVGLPETGTVYCCFNNNYKIVPRIFDSWVRILTSVDGSVIWLLEDNATAAKNLRKEARERGLDDERLIFAKRVPPAEHLARHRLADLFLDTLPCNAHTTASDALWAGLPLLTCMGQTFAGRVAASLLKAIGLPELITVTLNQYEELAVQLGTDRCRLHQIKMKLDGNRLTTPLFDTSKYTKHLESLYLQMFRRNQSDQPPTHIFA